MRNFIVICNNNIVKIIIRRDFETYLKDIDITRNLQSNDDLSILNIIDPKCEIIIKMMI